MANRLFARVISNGFEIGNGGGGYPRGWVLRADAERSAEALALAHERGHVEFFVADDATQAIHVPTSPGSGLPIVGAVAAFGERPSRAGVRRRCQKVFWSMLDRVTRDEIIGDPQCPFRHVTNYTPALFDWAPTTDVAKVAFARFEAYVDRESSKFEKRFNRNKEAAQKFVAQNLATFARDAERIEAEAAELAQRAARMREQADLARSIKTRAELESEAKGSGKSAERARTALATMTAADEFQEARTLLQRAFDGLDHVQGTLAPTVRAKVSALVAAGQAAVQERDAAKIREVVSAIAEALVIKQPGVGGLGIQPAGLLGP